MDLIKLKQEGAVNLDNGKEFTRLVGGFGDDKPVITVKQVADLLGYTNGVKTVNLTIKRNIDIFEDYHLIDLKSVSDRNPSIITTLKSIGYSQQSIEQSNNIYVLSEAGFLLYLKFAEGDKAVELYKNFIEDYFKTKAENAIMKNSIEEQIESLKQEKAKLYGISILESDDIKRAMIFRSVENITNSIVELEKSLMQEETIKKLQSKLELSDNIENSKTNYDLGVFSKILGIKGLGRNKFFEWLRNEKILMKNNVPYQQYFKYFSVIPVTNYHTNETYNKSLLKPNGVDFLIKRLIDANMIIPKSIEQIKNELNNKLKEE